MTRIQEKMFAIHAHKPTNYKEKNQSIEMDPEITEALNFAYKDLKTAIISMPKI